MAHVIEIAVPRRGWEKRWFELADRLNLSNDARKELEAFMSDLSDAFFDDGVCQGQSCQ